MRRRTRGTRAEAGRLKAATTEPVGTLAPGESADDLARELDALRAAIQRREISLGEFVAALRRIDALVAERVGERRGNGGR